MSLVRLSRAALAALALPAALMAQGKPLPLKHAGAPTKPEISAADLMTRLYQFADDSMMGRQTGTPWNSKGTDYIAAEVKRFGLQPAGDNGSFFQELPYVLRSMDTTSTITVDGKAYRFGVDFMATTAARTAPNLEGRGVVHVGMLYDSANRPDAAALRGKIIVMRPFFPGPGFNQAAFVASDNFKAWQAALEGVAAMVGPLPGPITPAVISGAVNPTRARYVPRPEAPLTVQASAPLIDAILGTSAATAPIGPVSRAVSIAVRMNDTPKPWGRNVVALLPGSDPKLKGQYVAIGAHNDHVGFNNRPIEHDSIKAYNRIVRPQGAEDGRKTATPEQLPAIKALMDSLRAAHGGTRMDSIFNGADDDGSGSVSVLEIAEAFAKAKVKPKRSILFVWHTGEEAGLLGSEWFTDHPTVPRDSIVAQLNMDMVGRGAAADVAGVTKSGEKIMGGPGYLQLVGSRRLSTELGDLIEKVNTNGKFGFTFDYAIDADGHPQNIYCRSDHYEYARYGIPIIFATTGVHSDYHQVTDEPQYIDYDRMSATSRLMYATALEVANLDHRVVVDKPKPDPKGSCRQ